jgi:hypothetical protein
MHIFHRTASGKVRRHRLFIALPLFSACLFISLFQAHQRTANAVEEAPVTGVVQLNEEPTLVAGIGIARAEAGEYHLVTWHGAFDGSYQGDQLSVAALTAPVVITKGTYAWLVPAGMQLSLQGEGVSISDDLSGWMARRMPLPLPDHYLEERLPDALHALDEQPVHKNMLDSASLLFGAQILQLPQARERAQKQQDAQLMDELKTALKDGENALAQGLLQDPQVQERIIANSANNPLLLAYAIGTGSESAFLPSFMKQSDQRLLALYHPAIRNNAWLLASEAEPSMDIRLIQTLLTPIADHQDEALLALSVERWADAWGTMLKKSKDPTALLSAAMPHVLLSIEALQQNGYPERAQRYAKALDQTANSYGDVVPEEVTALFARITDIAAGAVQMPSTPVIEQASAEIIVQEPAKILSEDQLIAEATSILTAKNCMFTAQTKITAIGDNRVRIEGIAIGSPNGDKLASFTYDPVEDIVDEIQKEGSVLPYSVTLEKYLAWERQN